MIDFTEYVVSELKSKRLSKTNALALIKQFYFKNKNDSAGSTIHPLLHTNTSSLNEQSYATLLTGDEFFLQDHQINGQKVLPGVAYLEMVRVAVEKAMSLQSGSALIELQNVIWAQPIVVNEPTEVTIALFLNDSHENNKSQTNSIGYEIYSVTSDNQGNKKEIIHSQGQALISNQPEEIKLDTEQLRSQMNMGELNALEVYSAYEKMGLSYGPSHRAVTRVHQGENQLLAKLDLPDVVESSLSEYLLHPSVMDAVLQSAVGFTSDINSVPDYPSLPFAIESLQIFSGCTRNMFAWLRYASGSKPSDKITKLDIDLCDLQGNVCVQIRGFSSRQLGGEVSINLETATEGRLHALPHWHVESEPLKTSQFEYHKIQIISCDLPKIDAKHVEVSIEKSQYIPIHTNQENNSAETYCEVAKTCFDQIKKLLESKLEAKTLLQVVISSNNDLLLSGLSGLLKTASLENPSLVNQLIFVDADISSEALIHTLKIEQESATGSVIKYHGDKRQVLTWREIDIPAEQQKQQQKEHHKLALKDSGVYLITGGLGGLGLLFAKEIADQTNNSKIILTGRSELNAESKVFLDALSANNNLTVVYIQADITRSEQVITLIENIIEQYGYLSGVIHAAGVIADNFILKKSSTEFEAVLDPKVIGTYNLDIATSQLELDFFVFFSSVSAIFGNPGQADYACANGFMDQYAHYRNQLVLQNERHGRSISINWPLWHEGGMLVDQAIRDALLAISGMQPMDTFSGLQAFYQILQSPNSQTLVMQGDLKKLRQNFMAKINSLEESEQQSVSTAENIAVTSSMDSHSLVEKTHDYLRQQLSQLLKLPAQKIDVQAALEKYGIDSILSMNITNQLEKTFGSLPKTLFFEYQTIAQLSDYFLKNHQPQLVSLFGNVVGEKTENKQPVNTKKTENKLFLSDDNTIKTSSRGARFLNSRTEIATHNTTANFDEPIAIVGLSGRYPESPNLDVYWNNLRDGKDCITEIPKSRWDWHEYYSEDRRQEGHHFSKWGGFIEGVDEFDPRFFNISPLEAEYIDPQERLFLQHVWMAVEDAGLTRASLQISHNSDLPGQVGVYAGVMYSEYQLFGAEASMRGKRVGVAGSFASIANRVSYVLNLHGPSMTLDTMCSSSLTAIHMACQDLKQGRTDAAIAGGVNISIHPSKYLVLSAGQFISSDGHCQSFGEGGDGYIPGEGVGVVVLKRLSDAERDGHQIYGIIKGSALNHGGKTNGYSVPNPQAQSSAINRALAEAQINPRHISYIEAHGTGTKLGDPIEISALTKAFNQSPENKNVEDRAYCLIGSAKSNIGHCESAAGIAGVTKILLQLKHQKIVPSLHSSKLNPHINFDETPFIVNQQLTDWSAPEVHGKVLPRIAGISSFGAGGSNAHIIIEDYRAKTIMEPAAEINSSEQIIILLSARTAMQLRQKARDLLDFIGNKDLYINLPSMAYTLQVGREAMDERLAFIIQSVEQLTEKLQAFINDDQFIPDFYRGKVDADKEGMGTINQDDDMIEAIDKWIARKKFSKLLEFWVNGLALDWNSFYDIKPKFISLPTYPFAKERYWIASNSTDKSALLKATSILHPLVHKNISDLHQQCYSSQFNGDEFFLRDHQLRLSEIQSQKVLPAVVYLEMARAAVEQASGSTREFGILELHNTVWIKPLLVTEPTEIIIGLQVEDENHIAYGIYGRDNTAAEQKENDILHCQGMAFFSQQPAPARLDLNQIKTGILQSEINSEAIYSAYSDIGIIYGPTFKGITALYKGENQLLAELDLPSQLKSQHNEFILHPSLLDAALQASIGLAGDLGQLNKQPILPFALDSMRIIFACSEKMFAWIRFAAGSKAGDALIKLDIDLCDQQGNICLQMRGFTSRQVNANVLDVLNIKSVDRINAAHEVLFATPIWKKTTIDLALNHKVSYVERHIIVGEQLNNLIPELSTALKQEHNLHIIPKGDDENNLANDYRAFALACFDVVKNLLLQKPEGNVFVQIILDGEKQENFSGLSGLLKTASLENSHITGQILLLETHLSTNELKAQILDNQISPQNDVIRYNAGEREIFEWREIIGDDRNNKASLPNAFKDEGVYLITGGLGGLGIEFAREILAKTQNAKIIFTGRSSFSEDKASLLASLSTTQDQLIYRQVDLNNLVDVCVLIEWIQQEYQGFNGILHSAGMTADNFILKKNAQEFSKVLEPKVSGVFNLDEATKNMSLDFMVFFSSVSSALGNPGQADYAAANGFMDQFAAYRNELVVAGQRTGQTVSINWPLWEMGGMQMDSASLEILKRAAGVVPMQTATGMEIFHRSLALKLNQSLVMEGNLEKMRNTLFFTSQITIDSAQNDQSLLQTNTESLPDNLTEKTQDYLRTLFSSTLKLSAEEIDPKAALEKYGIDSIVAMKLTNDLENVFGSLSKTLLFEYQTVAALAGYFSRNFSQKVKERIGIKSTDKSIPIASSIAIEKSHSVFTKVSTSRNRFLTTKQTQTREVAIIGLSGKYPQADDLDEFWKNLQEGRDCISEIPTERWNNSRFFNHQRNQAGKTYSNWGGFISDVDKFDPLFFNISPKEAELIDPQERLFLQTVWQTIEDAGYSKEQISANRVGVYVGVMWGQYELFGADAILLGDTHIPTSSYASIANRISYYFDFHGPSIALDTMCSSSLTAIHLACEAIRSNEIDAAIAGGVNLSIHPQKYLNLSQGNFSASDGRCRSFGANGDGYVPGEGVGALLLKSLDKAIEDGDQIYAVIKSTTINHGGKTNGYTVPNPNAQGELILEALKKAKIEPNTLSYIETHGTGTSLGDPIEITGLKNAFADFAIEKQTCPIGSVKSNIGHLESAAGIAAITKVLLQIKYKQLVPSLHADPLNPNIDFENSPFYVQKSLTEWSAVENRPKRIGVSSFGAGGSNGHVILEEFIDSRTSNWQTGTPEAILISAKNHDALIRYVEKFIHFLNKSETISLADIAYTTQVGRTAMNERLVIIASDLNELKNKFIQWSASNIENSSITRRELEGIYQANIKDAKQDGASAIIQGDAGKAFLKVTLEKNDLAKIAKLWVSGVDIDWQQLNRSSIPKKISLPNYPFAKERYWVKLSPLLSSGSGKHQQQLISENIQVKKIEEEKAMLFYRPEWKKSDLNHADESTTFSGPVLVVDKSDQLFLTIKKYLETSSVHSDISIVWVKPDQTYQKINPDSYSANFENVDDIALLLETLGIENKQPCDIIYNANESDYVKPEDEFLALSHLCQSLLKQKQFLPIRLIAVSSASTGITQPAHAAIAGLFKTLSLENPKYSGKVLEIFNIDKFATESKSFETHLLPILITEFQDQHWQKNEIRYQINNQQHAVRLVRELAAFNPIETLREMPIKQKGVYLISGGLGGLGFIFAKYLAEHAMAKIIVFGRSELTSEHQEKLNELLVFTTEAIYMKVDVTQFNDVQKLINETKSRFGDINGVIHSAGTTRDSFLLKKTKAEMDLVLTPKIHGVINLDKATENENLDLFILFSSIAGVTGNLGQSDYAYANHFLDSFAEVRSELRSQNKRSGKTLSINWPYWENGGMSLSEVDVSLMNKGTGISPLPTNMGLKYWETFLQSEVVQGIALYGNPEKIRAYFEHKQLHNSVNTVTKSLTSKYIGEDVLEEKLKSYLKELVGDAINLSTDRIDIDEQFTAFGIDSIIINKINMKLEQDFGALPKTLFYEYETIAELTSYLAHDMHASVTAYFNVDDQNLSVETIEMSLSNLNTNQPTVNNVQTIQANEPIAIIGVHGIYPQSADLNEFWTNLKTGKDLIDVVPFSRWDYEDYYDADPGKANEGKIYCKWGGFLKDVDKFDPAFFNIAPSDAKMIDPQERLFLQSVWSAFENAGYTKERLKQFYPKGKSANVGVFVGVTTNSYQLLGAQIDKDNLVNPASLPWSIANRVSYFFDFQGPSMPIDTACSSSLVAIDLACDSLRKGDCQVAVAGGVNLYLHPSKYQTFCQRRMISTDGKTRSFGAGEEGFVPSEGVGTLILKPLSNAVKDGDTIHAVIRASGYEHSGRSNGYSAPNPNSQASLINQTLIKGQVNPETIGYVEGHGTGTQLGDSLEIAALTNAFQLHTSKQQFCSVGSVKANMGHPEAVAGIAGITKILLQFKNKLLVPTINSEQPNPDIDFKNSPFYLQHKLTPWKPVQDNPRRAMINSFGSGGVNACLILDEYEQSQTINSGVKNAPNLFVLSAKNSDRLNTHIKNLRLFIEAEADINLTELAFSLQVGREAMSEKLAIIAKDRHELIKLLAKANSNGVTENIEGIYIGHADSSSRKRKNELDKETAQEIYRSKDWHKLAQLWIEGWNIEWDLLYPGDKPKRLMVPTYPFAEERYWAVDSNKSLQSTEHAKVANQLHPLVSYNSSNLRDISFTSHLTANEFYGRDHKINGKAIFPGAGFIEIACVAGTIAGVNRVKRIQDIVWIQPLVFNEELETIQISLKANGDSADFWISSLNENHEKIIHSEGIICFEKEVTKTTEDVVMVHSLMEECPKSVDGNYYYQQFEQSGFNYGSSFQTIQKLYLNENYALSKIKLVENLKGNFEEFLLHPCLLDGALQTVGALASAGDVSIPYVPFAIGELEIVNTLSPSCYVYVELADTERKSSADVKKFNIKLLSEQGNTLVNIKNFCVRAITKQQMSNQQIIDAIS